jgi:hypothetical protein
MTLGSVKTRRHIALGFGNVRIFRCEEAITVGNYKQNINIRVVASPVARLLSMALIRHNQV